MVQVKVIKEPYCFDGVRLDRTIYLRCIQTLEDYLEIKGWLDKFYGNYLKTSRLYPIVV